MKLAHIVPSLEEKHGGPSKSVRALCAALAHQNDHVDQVDLLTTHPDAPATGESSLDGALQLRTFRRDFPQRICPSRGLRHALASTAYDVVHHHALWLRTLHYAHRSAARHRAPLVLSPRGMMSAWAWRHNRWRKRVSRFLIHPGALDAVAGWHATSAEEEAEIRALGFQQPVCVAPNGVAAPTAAEIAAATAHWQAACPDVTSRPTAVFYSRFHVKKRVLELIDLWIARAPRDWLLLLVGIPQDYTPEELERYAQRLSGAGRIAAFSGAGRPAPYAVASLFVLPSHNENFGLVVAEAMAHGVPVVVTDTTPWRALNAGGHGWCVPWSAYGDALVAATSEAAAARQARGAAARAWVLRDFSWDRSAQILAHFYATLARSKR